MKKLSDYPDPLYQNNAKSMYTSLHYSLNHDFDEVGTD